MPDVSAEKLSAIAAKLGHSGLTVQPTRSGYNWVAYCDCGWKSDPQKTPKLTAQRAVKHVEGAIAAYVAAGRSISQLEQKESVA
jgi:hypothetical protein